MRRRDIIASVAAAIVASSALAQRGKLRIALVHSGVPAAELTESAGPHWVRRFLKELRRLGYVEGDNILVQRYSGEGHQERFAALAREVVTSEPNLIVMNTNVLARAFQAATPTIPLVGVVTDPLRAGVVPSLARPGGTFTGVSVDAGAGLLGKRLQVLKELLPSVDRVAYFGPPVEWNGPTGEELRAAGGRLGITVFGLLSDHIDPEELRRLFDAAVRARADAAVMSAGGFLLQHRHAIANWRQPTACPRSMPSAIT